MRSQNNFFKISFLLFLAIMILFLVPAEGQTPDPCLKAFERCMMDPIWAANILGSLYCITGYLFCVKYIGE